MANIDRKSESFKLKYDTFIVGCDAAEEDGLWDTSAYGQMEALYSNDLISVILRLIAADGSVSQKETDYLNGNFGFDYTADELAEVYENCEENIGRDFDKMFEDGVSRLRNIRPALADMYKELLGLICSIIAESDGIVTQDELLEMQRLAALTD